MKKLLGIVVLGLLLSFNANADDIKDFQIEGISIGDSALKVLSKKKIIEEFEIGKDEYSWTDQKFADVYNYESQTYEKIVMSVKRNDDKFIIYALTGQNDYTNINHCFKKQNEIEKEFNLLLNKAKKDKWTQKHPQDKTGKSKVHFITYSLDDNSKVEVICYELSKHFNQPSGLDVGIISAEYRNWLNSFE